MFCFAHIEFKHPVDPLLICTCFLKIQVVKSSSTNWIFSLQKSISKLIFADYTGSKNPVFKLQVQFGELDFSKLIFQKSSMYRSTGGAMVDFFSYYLFQEVGLIYLHYLPLHRPCLNILWLCHFCHTCLSPLALQPLDLQQPPPPPHLMISTKLVQGQMQMNLRDFGDISFQIKRIMSRLEWTILVLFSQRWFMKSR